MAKDVKMGKLQRTFNNGNYQDITLSVTEECNLRCKYCYMVGKNTFSRMSWDTAKKAVDEILSMPVKFDSVVWDFIGGEPTLEMELIDRITDYIKIRTFELNHPWFGNSMFFIGSNGLLYESKAVQNYLEKNRGISTVAITIDGNKEKHDLQRVHKDGSGSYDDVLRNVKLWIKQNPGSISTKVTFSNDDLIYLKDSIVELWNLGIDYVSANVVFEDVWDENAPKVYNSQLKALADYVIENELWDKYSVRFFDHNIGFPMDANSLSNPYCGSGKMIAVSSDGKYYPCIRFLDFCLDKATEGLCIGKIGSGIEKSKLRPFENLSIGKTFADKCKTCRIAQGCPSCTGFNYDNSGGISIYSRSTYHCEMHKAQVNANKYFWMKYSQKTKEVSPLELNRFRRFSSNGWDLDNLSFLYILTSDAIIPYCDYQPHGNAEMSNEDIERVVDFAFANDYVPVIVTNNPNDLPDKVKYMVHATIFPAKNFPKETSEVGIYIPIYEPDYLEQSVSNKARFGSCILNVTKGDVRKLSKCAEILSKQFGRININKILDEPWGDEDLEQYESELRKCRDQKINLNVFSATRGRTCGVGFNSNTVAPNGKVYPCPAFYFSKGVDIGKELTVEAIEGNKEVFDASRFAKCADCKNAVCSICPYENWQSFHDISTPSKAICSFANVENRVLG